MSLILRLRRYNSVYHNDIKWIKGAFIVRKWQIERAEPY